MNDGIDKATKKRFHDLAHSLSIAYIANQAGCSYTWAEQKYGDRPVGDFWYMVAIEISAGMVKQKDRAATEAVAALKRD